MQQNFSIQIKVDVYLMCMHIYMCMHVYTSSIIPNICIMKNLHYMSWVSAILQYPNVLNIFVLLLIYLDQTQFIYLKNSLLSIKKKTINTEVNIYTLVCSCIFKEYCTAVYTFMLTLVFTDLRRIMYFTLITILI